MGDKLRAIEGFVHLLRHHRGETSGSYDDAAAGYDAFATVWDGWVARAAMDRYDAHLRARIPAGGHVLDAGAGTGERTRRILDGSDPGRVVAFDASEGMLNVAKGKIDDPRVTWVLGDVTALPFPDETFDVVSCSWVIEILDDPRKAVEELLRVLKPGGAVIYAFCSLPDGALGDVAGWIGRHVVPDANPLSHLLPASEQPFHDCGASSLERFSLGLTSVAVLGKCCQVSAPGLPCALEVDLLA